MPFQALCLIKLLVIFSIFECIFCSEHTFYIDYGNLDRDTDRVKHKLAIFGEPSTVIGVISKCMLYEDGRYTRFKVLARNETDSRLIELDVQLNYNFIDGTTYTVLSRDDFTATMCFKITIPYDDCTIDHNLCKKFWRITNSGSGLYTKTDHCVQLLKTLGYSKTQLQQNKEKQPERMCPLSDMEILVLAPDMFNSTYDDRPLTTKQIKSVFPFLKKEFNAWESDHEITELVDGPHRIMNKNRMLEYYVKLQSKTTYEIMPYYILRVWYADSEPFLHFRRSG